MARPADRRLEPRRRGDALRVRQPRPHHSGPRPTPAPISRSHAGELRSRDATTSTTTWAASTNRGSTRSIQRRSGTVGDYLPSKTWYDAAGQTSVKTATGNGLFQKYAYDGLGRLVDVLHLLRHRRNGLRRRRRRDRRHGHRADADLVRPGRPDRRHGHLPAAARRHQHHRRARRRQQLRHGLGRLVRRAGPHDRHGRLRPRGRRFRPDALLLQRPRPAH